MNSQVLKNMMERRSVRAYSDRQVSREDLETILLAGRWAPTGMNLQSWRFTAILDRGVRDKVNEALRLALAELPPEQATSDYMRGLMKKAQQPGAEFLYGAPAYVLISNLADNYNAMADCALAAGNMMLMARELGIGSVWLNQIPGLTKAPAIRRMMQELEIPPEHDIFASVALGYPAQEKFPDAPPRRENPAVIIE